MTTDSQYSWPRFFMELADKLLAFKDDRQALIATLRQVYAEIGMALPTLDSSGDPTDIDPFTVYGLFNRRLADTGGVWVFRTVCCERVVLSSPGCLWPG